MWGGGAATEGTTGLPYPLPPGAEPSLLPNPTGAEIVAGRRPRLSGDWIAFRVVEPSDASRLAVMHLDGSGLRVLDYPTAGGAGYLSSFDWTPDGQRIVMSDYETVVSVEPFAADPTATALALFSYEYADVDCPKGFLVDSVSPDGRLVMLTVDNFDEYCQDSDSWIFVATDGSQATVRTAPAPGFGPQWGGDWQPVPPPRPECTVTGTPATTCSLGPGAMT